MNDAWVNQLFVVYQNYTEYIVELLESWKKDYSF